MYAITTEILGATDNQGTRVRASTDGLAYTMPYDYGISDTDNHREAARELARRKGWTTGTWTMGSVGHSMAWVNSHGAAFEFVGHKELP